MDGWTGVIVRARLAAGLSQVELAGRAGTSRPTLSAYERGRKAPTADTLERLLFAAGFRLDAVPVVGWREVALSAGRTGWVPDRLWRLPVADAVAEVALPVELNWSAPGRRFALAQRQDRARLYEVVLREGQPADLERWVDGLLLIDLWGELVLPTALRAAWQSVLDAELAPQPAIAGGGARAGVV